MTSPHYDPAFGVRMREAAAAVGERPGLAATLAASDLTTGDMQVAGGFARGLEDAQLVRLARASGARLSLDPDQQSRLDALQEPYKDVNDSQDDDTRNWLERIFDKGATALANTGSFLADLPGVHQVFTALDWLNNVAHLPERLLSSGLDSANDNEIRDAMVAKGYDPTSLGSRIAFFTNQGDSIYHDLDGIREEYGDEAVDLAIEQQADPEGFAEKLYTRSEKVQKLALSPEFAKVADLVDRQHISPGRDIASLLLPKSLENGAVFTGLSGALDGAYTLLLDPTLIAGKVATGVRALDAAGNAIRPASRLDRLTGVTSLTGAFGRTSVGRRFASGLRDATDQDGIRGLLAVDDTGKPVTRTGAGVQSFLDQVKAFDTATDEAEKTVIFARLQAEHRPLMPLFDEVRGKRVLTPRAQAYWAQREGQTDDVIDYFDELGKEPGVAEAVGDNPLDTILDPKRADGTLATEPQPSFEHKIKDVNGVGWLATQTDPIYDLKDFADYFADTAGMLRLADGAAAKRELLLPGRVALRQRVAGLNAELRAKRGLARNSVVYDHSNPYKLLPHEAEEQYQKALDDVAKLESSGQIDAAEAARRGDLIYQEIRGKAGIIRKQRAKWEQRARRVSSLLPTVSTLDLTSADSIEQVRRFARLYMNKAEADRLTATYAAGDLGRRRQVAMGIIEQTLHAAGLSRSEEGLAQIERFRADQINLDKRAYGLSRTDVIKTEAGDRHVALLPSQLSEKVLLPDFRSLQYLATKHAVGGVLTRAGHLRSILTNDKTDAVMAAIKMGWITTAAGGTRNALDEVAGAVLRQGGASELARGRAAYSKATAAGRRTERAARLEARNLGSIPRALRGLPKTIEDVLLARTLGKVLSYTRHELDDDAVKYAKELQEDARNEVLDESIVGTYYGDDISRHNDEALELHRSGLAAAPVRHNGELVKYEFQGWGQVEVDGGVGLDAMSNSLGMAFQDLTSPAHVALKGILEGRDAITDVVNYMQTPVMRHFLRDAEIFQVTRAGKKAVTTAEKLEAIENYAERLIAHVTMLVSGRGAKLADADELAGAAARYEFDITSPEWWKNPGYEPGPINEKLAEMLLKGDIPDRAWLKENLSEEELPSHVIGKRYAPVNPTHKPGQIAQGYTSMLAKAYDLMVTRQVRALSRNPMLAAAYDQARRNLAGYEQALRDAGFQDEAVDAIVRRSARTQAEHLVIKSVDDPTLSTQYAMLARNFHAFARAQEDWLRRWGRAIRDDPAILRRGQLALHGAESAGLVEKDDQGNLIFTYPGSGAVINAFGKISSLIPGVGDVVKFPIVPDLTSRLIFTNPSLDNPIGFSATPIISIPFDYILSLTGKDHALLASSMDRAINGELGAGREWYEKILPGFANRIISGVLSDEDPASQYASSVTSALMNLEAAGRLDDIDGTDPTALARLQNDLGAQVSNQMVARALFGFFLPAAPSTPTNDVTDKETGKRVLKPDYVWEKAGLSSLKDEARKAFATMPYDQALEWWAKYHPGELVYQVGSTPRTTVGDSEAQAPATIAAAKWMQDNQYLLDNYGRKGGIATYFIPQGTGQEGEFSMDAYRAQLETGIREYKTLDEFFRDIVIQRGEAVYFDTKDDVDKAIAAATAGGDLAEVQRLNDWWATKKEQIKAANPLMAAKFAEYATSGVAREQTIAQLNRLLADPKAVAALGDQAGGVAELLFAQRQYQAARDAVAYQRGYYAQTKREEAKTLFEQTIADVVDRFPGLGDLARGAFRVPD